MVAVDVPKVAVGTAHNEPDTDDRHDGAEVDPGVLKRKREKVRLLAAHQQTKTHQTVGPDFPEGERKPHRDPRETPIEYAGVGGFVIRSSSGHASLSHVQALVRGNPAPR